MGTAASELFGSYPQKKVEDLRSKPQTFFKKKAQPADGRQYPRERHKFFLHQ